MAHVVILIKTKTGKGKVGRGGGVYREITKAKIDDDKCLSLDITWGHKKSKGQQFVENSNPI